MEGTPGTPSPTSEPGGVVQPSTLTVARSELMRGLVGLLGIAPPVVTRPTRAGAVIVGSVESSPLVRGLKLGFAELGDEGYLIQTLRFEGQRVLVIAGKTDVGALHGVFHFLRLLQTEVLPADISITSVPRIRYRILDHWDNLDGSVERGYAGASIWNWTTLPDYLEPRYTDYARACASLGINGMVPTNVNASAAALAPLYLRKLAALARVFRPYGLRVYLTARFSAPIEIGGLKSADPLDPAVRRWWRSKTDEIYTLIPDFGGFLVKADSEGQPGPQDYGRTHAEGANMLADALAPHGGIVMWRAFVYANRPGEDRAKQAYDEFEPLDGQFRPNVLLQVKNGPIDFQPREPFHPLFGAMPRTAVSLEVQITKEYLGFATHLVYLGPLYEETLRSDTYARGADSTVAKVIDGSLFGNRVTGIAGVANVGADRNWCGSIFDQANWYAFGRLAWDPFLSASAIAEEWVRMTFSSDPTLVAPVVGVMMRSREAAVDYMTPLGLAHQMAPSHYGPAPWLTADPPTASTSVYFNRADGHGIGFDRTVMGSDAVAQYAPAAAQRFGRLDSVPEVLLLWFHHVAWDYPMRSGRSVWEELVRHYDEGVATVGEMQRVWARLSHRVDVERFGQVQASLMIQEREARWWRDASVAYFQSVSGQPLPADAEPPAHPLAYYEAICIPFVPGAPTGSAPLCRMGSP
jgi:alpha-glucuronidase